MVGYNYGARSRGRIVALIRFALEIGVVIMAAGTLLLALFPHRFLQLFHAESNVLATGVSALRMISSGFVFAGVSVILCAAFQAMGASMLSLAVSLSRQLVLILPAALLLGRFSPRFMWLCFPIAELLSCLLALLFYRKVYREKLVPMSER